MARKVCPSCKQVNAASATGCAKCGHAFDMSLVKAATRARRCPMCGMVSPSSVKSCESCHYDYDDDQQDLETFLKHRVSIGRWTAGAGVLVMLLAVPMLFLFWMIAIGNMLAGAILFRRGARIINAARSGLDDLAARHAALPAARVVER